MKTNPFLALHKRRIAKMTPDQVFTEAKRRKYRFYIAPSGKLRIGGSPSKSGPDLWMNEANVFLWKIETGKLRPVALASGAIIYV